MAEMTTTPVAREQAARHIDQALAAVSRWDCAISALRQLSLHQGPGDPGEDLRMAIECVIASVEQPTADATEALDQLQSLIQRDQPRRRLSSDA